MAVLDVKDLEAAVKEAEGEIVQEKLSKAKSALKNQLRVVANAELVLTNERRKLDDLKAQILEGNL
jgi:hypothetical protein